MDQTALTCVLIGNDSLLIECGELWHARGHSIAAVVTDSARVAAWAKSRGLCSIPADDAYASALAQHSFDYLFAITFLRVIPAAVLALPRRAAVNFHDGPLPRYAGVNAPAWALLHQERQYGITWHLMSEQLDRGDLLKQVSFEINADETALSLNTRCFGFAIESFETLIDELAQGRAQALPQAHSDGAQRSYFGRYARPAAAAVLDFQAPAAALSALVRALDFGPRYPNSLGAATLLASGHAFIVTSAEASLERSAAAPGTIIGAGADSISVACAEGTLIIKGLRRPNRAPVPMGAALAELGLAVGDALDSLTPAERAQLSALDAELARSERFWVDQLATLDPTEPPYLCASSGPTPEPKAEPGAADFAELALELPAAFRARFPAESAVVAAFASYMGRMAGTSRVALAWPAVVGGVGSAGVLSSLMAACVPLVLEVEPASSLAELAARFEAAVEQARGARGFLRNVGARYPQLAGAAALSQPALVPLGVALGVGAPVMAGTLLQLAIAAGAARLRYRSDRLRDADAARIAAELFDYMQNLALAADQPVEAVRLLSQTAERQLLAYLNPTQRPLSELSCVHRLIEAQVDRTPQRVAVACGGRTLTFRQLDDAANSVAQRLLELGVGADQPVGVYVERSADLPIAALGVMKAGAAYVPLDPAYPAERVAFMLQDAQLGVVVTQRALASRLAGHGVRCVLTDDSAEAARAPRPNVAVGPEHLAYVIYTSGSTGKPKGVMVEHRQVANFFAGMDERIARGPDDRAVFLAVTSLSFDISVLELWWSLARGFKVVVHRDDARTGAASGAQPVGMGAGAASRPVEFSLFYFSADAHAAGGARYRLLIEGAKFADEHGFAAVWTPERHFHAFGGLYPNPAITGAAVAAITQRVGIRAGSVVLPLHHPARVAEQWAVVDNLSNGRVGISVASGWQPDDFVFAPDNYRDAKAVMMRNLELVRRLWRGEGVSFEGPQGPVLVRTLPEPVQRELPVWITTAGNAETFELAGRAGANVLTHLLGQSLDKLAPKIAAYRAARAAAGFDPNTGIVSLMMHSFVGEDRQAVKALVREPLKAYLATSLDLIKDKAWAFPAFARPQGKRADELDGDLTSLSDADRDALLEAAFERYFEHSGLFGSPDDALAMLQKVKAIGVDDVACLIDFGAPTQIVLDHLPQLAELRRRELQGRAALAQAASEPEPAAEHPLLRDVREHAVTHLQCTPSMARMLLDHPDSRAALGQIEQLLIGGEALSADLLRDLRAATRACITNMYGPTETTVWSSTQRIAQGENPTGPVSIGKPIVNTTFYVADAQGRLLPAGAPGELWIGGHGVTRGYWQRPELSAERFVRDPYANDPQARMYRTGDRVRYRLNGTDGTDGTGADASLEFLGRGDQQVKLRGYRIELGEIEARVRAIGGVKDAVVIVREDSPGDQRLVGYLVPEERSLDVAQVRQQLRAQLPEFMVPGAFVVLPELPLTPNRKVDRKALPAGQLRAAGAAQAASAGADGAAQPPQSETERQIAAVWRDVLGRDDMGLDENFFDLGGHSLLVVRAHRQLQDALGRALALTDCYRFPTIRKLAAFLSQHATGAFSDTSDTQKAGARGAKRREAMRRRIG